MTAASTAARTTAPVAPGPRISDRLIEAASQITCDTGWPDVTMAKLAARVGVSRQTVYNEVGSKPALGQAMVLRELDRFLAVVAAELDAHEDVVEAIRAASEQTLLMARGNPLLRAVLSSAHGGTSELLPYLTTQAEPLLEAATSVLNERVTKRFPGLGLTGHDLEVAMDSIVRLVLSHVMHSDDPPRKSADDIAWIAARVLSG